MTETDPLKLLYRRLRDNVTRGVAGDVMQMPPSWGELLTAVHEAAFPGDEDTTDREAAEAAAFAAGAKAQREADHSHLMSRGESFPAGMLHNRPLVTGDDTNTVTSGIEAAKRIAYVEGYDFGYAAGYREAQRGFAGGGEA